VHATVNEFRVDLYPGLLSACSRPEPRCSNRLPSHSVAQRVLRSKEEVCPITMTYSRASRETARANLHLLQPHSSSKRHLRHPPGGRLGCFGCLLSLLLGRVRRLLLLELRLIHVQPLVQHLSHHNSQPRPANNLSVDSPARPTCLATAHWTRPRPLPALARIPPARVEDDDGSAGARDSTLSLSSPCGRG
jgi:hypothetical protein